MRRKNQLSVLQQPTFSGNISDEELEKIKEYCINPVDSREADEKKPETLVTDYEDPADVAIFDDGFKDMPEEELKKLMIL